MVFKNISISWNNLWKVKVSVPNNNLCVICHKFEGTRVLLRQPSNSAGCCEECYKKLNKKKCAGFGKK